MDRSLRFFAKFGSLLCISSCFSCAVLGQTREVRTSENGIDIDVVDVRPVSAALQLLAQQHPFDITYEDPRYVYAGDVSDLAAGRASRDGQWLVPRTETLGVSLSLTVDSATDGDWVSAIIEMVDAYSRSSTSAQFRVDQDSNALHVIPVAHRDEVGAMSAQEAILDALISIPAQEMNGYEMILKLCEAVSVSVTGSYDSDRTLDNFLKPMRMPVNSLVSFTGTLEADSEPARDVFMRVLRSISEETAWQLFITFDPNLGNYWVNVRGISRNPRSASATITLPERERRTIDPQDSVFLTPERKQEIQGELIESGSSE